MFFPLRCFFSSNNHINVLFPVANTLFKWGSIPKLIRTYAHKRDCSWISQKFQPSVLSLTWHPVIFCKSTMGTIHAVSLWEDRPEKAACLDRKSWALKTGSPWLCYPLLTVTWGTAYVSTVLCHLKNGSNKFTFQGHSRVAWECNCCYKRQLRGQHIARHRRTVSFFLLFSGVFSICCLYKQTKL